MIPLAANVVPNFIATVMAAGAFILSNWGGINQGVVPSLFSLAGIYSSVVFYFAFNEKLGLHHFIGIALTFSGIILLLVESSMKEQSTTSGKSTGFYAFITILVGAIIPFNFSFKHYFLRKFNKSYKTIDLTIDSQILEGLFQTIIMLFYLLTHSLSSIEWLYSIICGLLYMVGKISVGMAISYGFAGPANSITCNQTIV